MVNQLKNKFNACIYYGDCSSDINKASTSFNELLKLNGTIFYGTKECANDLINAVHFFKTFFNFKYIIHKLDPVSFEYNYSTYRRITLKEQKENILFIQLPKSQIKYFKHCKNAYHVNDFYSIMGRRKELQLGLAHEYLELSNKYHNIPSFLQKNEYSTIDNDISNKIIAINDYLQKNKINIDSWELSKFIDIYKISTIKSKSYKDTLNLINDVNDYYNKNKNVLSYIQFPYQYHLDEEFIKFMKKNLK